MSLQRYFFLILFVFLCYKGKANTIIDSTVLNTKWSAYWITAPNTSLKDFKVLNFRNTFRLTELDNEFIIHVSADNRYRLYINGNEVGKGPARGNLNHWNYETYDISEHLQVGDNIIAAVVWNFAEYAPLAQITNKTAFILQGNSAREELLNTNSNWKVYTNLSYLHPVSAPIYTSVGPNEVVDGSKYPFGWESAGFDDSDWVKPRLLGNGTPLGKTSGWEWALVPSTIPQMEYRKERFRSIVRTENVRHNDQFLKGKSAIMIGPYQKAKILLDQGQLTTAYPEFIFSKGKKARINISYAEALVDSNGNKGNRDSVEGKEMVDFLTDTYFAEGGLSRIFQPLWFRTYRYVEIEIETKDEELILEDVYGYFRAYPFQREAEFKSNDPLLTKIWDVGWRTARLCAGETYYDCPYYEQLQYIGDTRIQALISLNLTQDDRLVRNAIDQFRMSSLANGLTQSRYPSTEFQIIPGFSLIWVAMVHDYLMYRDDLDFIMEQKQAVENVLGWFEHQISTEGMLGKMDYWNFVDWSFGPWKPELPIGGTPPGTFEGNSSVLTLLYVYSLQKAVEVFEALGDSMKANYYRNQANKLKEKTYQLCWDVSKGMLADSPSKNSFSQHANALGVLVGLFPSNETQTVLTKVLDNHDVVEASLYFKFYLFEAIKKAGLGNQYLNYLEPWKEMLSIGLTTFSETPEPTRSDCHAWSAHPLLGFLGTICGINPSTAGYRSIKIEPNLGSLNHVDGKAVHPLGMVSVKLKRIGEKGLEGSIELPKGITGVFLWEGKEISLASGFQKVKL